MVRTLGTLQHCPMLDRSVWRRISTNQLISLYLPSSYDNLQRAGTQSAQSEGKCHFAEKQCFIAENKTSFRICRHHRVTSSDSSWCCPGNPSTQELLSRLFSPAFGGKVLLSGEYSSCLFTKNSRGLQFEEYSILRGSFLA